MTLWFCDRCGKQIQKDSYGAGKYGIQKTYYEEVDEGGYQIETRRVQRFLKFCDNCAMELEKFLDDELLQISPESILTGKPNKEG